MPDADLPSLLARLELEEHFETFEEEELELSHLLSMRPDLLVSSLDSLG